LQTIWVDEAGRLIADVAVEVRVAGGEADRVLAEPSAALLEDVSGRVECAADYAGACRTVS
jgi:hypothetical protein